MSISPLDSPPVLASPLLPVTVTPWGEKCAPPATPQPLVPMSFCAVMGRLADFSPRRISVGSELLVRSLEYPGVELGRGQACRGMTRSAAVTRFPWNCSISTLPHVDSRSFRREFFRSVVETVVVHIPPPILCICRRPAVPVPKPRPGEWDPPGEPSRGLECSLATAASPCFVGVEAGLSSAQGGTQDWERSPGSCAFDPTEVPCRVQSSFATAPPGESFALLPPSVPPGPRPPAVFSASGLLMPDPAGPGETGCSAPPGEGGADDGCALFTGAPASWAVAFGDLVLCGPIGEEGLCPSTIAQLGDFGVFLSRGLPPPPAFRGETGDESRVCCRAARPTGGSRAARPFNGGS